MRSGSAAPRTPTAAEAVTAATDIAVAAAAVDNDGDGTGEFSRDVSDGGRGDACGVTVVEGGQLLPLFADVAAQGTLYGTARPPPLVVCNRLEEWRLDGVEAPPPPPQLGSPSSSMHLRLTGPSADGRSVIGDKLRRECDVVHERRVGLELGLGVNDRLVGTGICIEGE